MRPHFAALTSGPQLVTPICTGPCDVRRMNGPPLSPPQAWTSGLWCLRSSPQISDGMIACGYAFSHAAAEITDMSPDSSELGAEAGPEPVWP